MENNIKINKRGEKFLNFMKKYGYLNVGWNVLKLKYLSIIIPWQLKLGLGFLFLP